MALEEGKLVINLEPINILSCVEESYLTLKHKFDKKNIKFSKRIDESLIALTEKVSFTNSVLNNLLTNAIKFSEKDSEIKVEALKTGDNIEILIIDQGVGIPLELKKHVFDTNIPTTRPGTEGEKGTGFGMHLVKRFIESYGGSIEIDTKDINEHQHDHGTTIKITLKAA